jgi:VPS62-like protein/insecticidal crystal toxin P42 protein
MPVVSDVRTFGELDLAFSTDLQLAWTTWGGHCDNPVAFFNGAVESGTAFYNLGSYPMGAETDPGNPDSSRISALMVRASTQANPDRPPLAAPVGYNEVWNDSRSHADMDGTCWAPVAPDGYTALGAYFQSGHGNRPPGNDPSVMVCVRNDLLAQVPLGSLIWNDAGSHHHGDLGVWWPTANPLELDDATMYVTAGTFIANPSYDAPSGPFFALCLPVPSVSASVEPQVPLLASRTTKPSNPAPLVDREVEVPFTAITDAAKPVSWQIANSPFYVLKRLVGFSCLEFYDNETEKDASGQWEVTSGLSEEQTSEFAAKVGVTIGAETGVSFLGAGGKVSASLTTEFGWTKGSAHSEMTSETSSLGYDVPPLHACALWKLDYSFRLSRADGTSVPGELAFVPSGLSATVEQFPQPTESGPRAIVREEGSGDEVQALAHTGA